MLLLLLLHLVLHQLVLSLEFVSAGQSGSIERPECLFSDDAFSSKFLIRHSSPDVCAGNSCHQEQREQEE